MTIFWIFFGLTIFGLVSYGLQILAVHYYTKRSWHYPDMGDQSCQTVPPISLLKPLRGVDDNLFDNLESFCLQDYPLYEVIFSLQDYNDPAYKVARKVKDKYPQKDIRIIVERCDLGLNPKVNNLIPAYRISRYQHILISDSNVKVDRNYLREIVEHLADPSVGLVSNLIQGINGRSIGSVFENLHLNTFIIGSVCFLDRFLKMPCVIGKSMLMRKADLEAIGGLTAVKDVLAEDYVIGEKMHKAGRKVMLSSHFIYNVNEYWGMNKFLNRHTRWGKLRWKIGGIKYLSELLSNAVFMSFLPIFMWNPSKLTLSFTAFVSLFKVAGDYYIGKKIKSDLNPFFYFLSPVKDLVIGVLWFIPIISNTIVWRGNRYLIGRESLLSPYPENSIWSWRYKIMETIKTRIAWSTK